MNTCPNRAPPPDGAVTVMADVPLFPSLIAVIVADPAARPVTSPLPLTRATPESLLTHVTTRPDRGLPLASRGVAVGCTPCPTGPLAAAGGTPPQATGILSPAM